MPLCWLNVYDNSDNGYVSLPVWVSVTLSNCNAESPEITVNTGLKTELTEY